MTNTRVHLMVSLMALFITILGCKTDHEEAFYATAPADLYQEQHRPQFHFTPKANWMNDPNGMFYYEGKYHLFYQHYPDSTVWGPMHWGHAESADLVHWEHLPIALYPDSLGCIFSGSAVVDIDNSSGLGNGEIPPIVAIFTHHDFEGEKAKTNAFQKQSIAYSTDGGYKWVKYAGNPVIPNSESIKDFRDPKVVWHEASSQWILALAAYDKVKFYGSKNLVDWTFLSDFGIKGDKRLWECPDLFPITDATTNTTKWVLIVSIQQQAPNGGTGSSYFIGDFDGREFVGDPTDQQWLDWGADNYAFVTWNNVPKKDNRVLGIGWMSNWQYAQTVPTNRWRSAMTLPRELTLSATDKGYMLNSRPVQELQHIRMDSLSMNQLQVTGDTTLATSHSTTPSETMMRVDLNKTTSDTFGFQAHNDFGEKLIVTFDRVLQEMRVDRRQTNANQFSDLFDKKIHRAPVDLTKKNLTLHVFVDAASIEIFVDNGRLSFTDIFFPSHDLNKLTLFAGDGECHIDQLTFYTLNSIW